MSNTSEEKVIYILGAKNKKNPKKKKTIKST